MKTHKIILAVVFIVCIFPLILKAQKEKKEEKELVFGLAPNPLVTMLSGSGKGMATVQKLFQTLSDEFKELYGYTITLKIYPAPKFLFKAFQDKEADFAMMPISQFLMAKKRSVPVNLIFYASAAGKRSASTYCIYVHKDSKVKKISQLQGKTFAVDYPMFFSKKDDLPPKESYICWVMARKIFLKNGINKPFSELFKEFRVLPVPFESVGYSVLLKRFDAYLSSEVDLQGLRNYDKGFIELIPLDCIDGPPVDAFVYRNSINQNILNKFKNYVLSPPKNSQMEKIFKKDYKGVKLYPAEEKDYSIYFQWLKEAEQKGWLKEFDDIMKKIPKPGEKKK